MSYHSTFLKERKLSLPRWVVGDCHHIMPFYFYPFSLFPNHNQLSRPKFIDSKSLIKQGLVSQFITKIPSTKINHTNRCVRPDKSWSPHVPSFHSLNALSVKYTVFQGVWCADSVASLQIIANSYPILKLTFVPPVHSI